MAQIKVATASRVMAGHAGVNDATRQRVLDAIQVLDYHPEIAGFLQCGR